MTFNVIDNVKELGVVPGELFFGEYDHRYTRVSGTIENDATIAGTQPDLTFTKGELVGLPVLKDTTWRFATAAEVATNTAEMGFIISGEAITDMAADDVSPSPYAILVRGPAFYNEGMAPTTDAYGAAISAANYRALAKRLDIIGKASPSTTTEQTT